MNKAYYYVNFIISRYLKLLLGQISNGNIFLRLIFLYFGYINTFIFVIYSVNITLKINNYIENNVQYYLPNTVTS